jgi:DNA-binding transcriptional LysR family regulator
MDWDDLRTFLAIVRHGTLSAAARALGVTQPTMGRRLAALEQRTGARLLQRLPGRFVLTPLGEAVLPNAERIEADAVAAELMIRGRDVALEGTVRLTTVDTLAARIIAPSVAELQCKHPGITVELVPDSRQLSLSKREADLAVRMTRFEGHNIIARKLGSMAIAVYASRAYLERAQKYPNEPHRIVTVLEDQAHLPEAELLQRLYPDAIVAMRSNSREVHVWAVKSGAAIGAIARFRGDAQPELERLHTDEPEVTRDIWLGVHRDLQHTPRVRAVIDCIAEGIKTHRAALHPAA